MSNKNTVIIVGAGASSEVGLPTGNILKDRIASLLDLKFTTYEQSGGDGDMYSAMIHAAQVNGGDPNKANQYVKSGWRIRDAMPQVISIDNFIDQCGGDKSIEFCAKISIVRSIIDAEKNSQLFIDRNNGESKIDFKKSQDTWFNSFIQLLTENCNIDKLKERLSSISFIVFNYDRCLEQFLYYSFQNIYNIDGKKAAELVSSIHIFHPYGTVGNLPWYGNDNVIDYGVKPDPVTLVKLASQIKTFTEGTDPGSSDVVSIREAVKNAGKVIFLGFAYHDLNLEIIKPDGNHKDEIKYYGTSYDMSESDKKIIVFELSKIAGTKAKNIILNNLTCSGIFKEYWRTFSFSR